SAAVLHNTPFLCAACNYPLRQLTEYRCPECGKEFDPHDITTVNAGKPLTAFARRMIKPVGWWFIAWVTLLALATLVAASGPASYWKWMMRCFYLWGFTGIWLVLRFFVAMVIHARRHQPIFLHQRKWLRWLAAPAIAGIAFTLLEFGVPFRVAFHFSKPALDRFATQALASGDLTFEDRWLGAFPARDISVYRGGVHFRVEGAGYTGKTGLSYQPKTISTGSNPVQFT
ncbi:MAG: hypothetical protein AB7V46_20765, partial [Thermomicrobiales bacterium]